MRRTSILLTILLSAGCKVYDPLYCDAENRCTDPERPFCDLGGEHPASEGVARTCIPDPEAGGLDAGPPDAGSDADGGGIDASGAGYPQPLVYWAFDEADVSGTILTAREGALSGAITGATLDPGGVAGDGIAFAGGTDHVDFGDVLDDVFAGADKQFSISIWIKPGSVFGTSNILAKVGVLACEPPERNLQLHLLLLDGVPNFRFWTPTNTHARFVSAETPLVLDLWQQLLVTYDGTVDLGPADRLRVYVDGVSQPLTVNGSLGDFPYDIEPTDAHLSLGKFVGASGEPCDTEELNGSLDELAVWPYVLTAEQAADVHGRGAAGQPLWPR